MRERSAVFREYHGWNAGAMARKCVPGKLLCKPLQTSDMTQPSLECLIEDCDLSVQVLQLCQCADPAPATQQHGRKAPRAQQWQRLWV